MLMSDGFCRKVTRCFLLIATAVFFTGCAVRPIDRNAVLLKSPAQTDSVMSLQRMQQSTGGSKTNWQLLAKRVFPRGGLQQASELFSQLTPEMDDSQCQEISLLTVELELAHNDFTGA